MNSNIVKKHISKVLNEYMGSEKDKDYLLLQDVFIDDNKEVYRLIGIIR